METGSNIVEVPGSKSRKVAGKKQQWYRTAILKKFGFSCNLPQISYFEYNLLFAYSFSTILNNSGFKNQYVSKRNLLFKTVSELKSVFNLKLQKTARIIFSGFNNVLIKSNFISIGFIEKVDLTNIYVPTGQGSNTLKKQIKWLSI
jgi:hypothetical protein